MFFGGSIAAMISSLKNNARPVRKFEDRFDTSKIKSKTIIKKKKISSDELSNVKLEIRNRLQKQRRKRLVASTITIIILSLIFVGSLAFVSKMTKVRLRAANQEMKEKELRKEEQRNNDIKNYIHLGKSSLSKNDYEEAKKHYNKAYLLDSKNDDVIIRTVEVYILDCLENEKECGICDYYIEIAQNEVSNERIEKELGDLYDKLLEKRRIEEELLLEEVYRLLNKGYKALDQYSLKTAEYFIYKAYHLDNKNYDTNIAILRLYVEKCLRNNDCYYVEGKFRSMEREYGLTPEIKNLKELYKKDN